jgi:hypothetical protein
MSRGICIRERCPLRSPLSFCVCLCNAASDSARCLRTASTVKLEIRMPSVVLVRGELKRTTDSILFGISFKTPTYFPPPAETIDEISVSPRSIAGAVSICWSDRCFKSFTLFQTASLSRLFHQNCFRLILKRGNCLVPGGIPFKINADRKPEFSVQPRRYVPGVIGSHP